MATRYLPTGSPFSRAIAYRPCSIRPPLGSPPAARGVNSMLPLSSGLPPTVTRPEIAFRPSGLSPQPGVRTRPASPQSRSQRLRRRHMPYLRSEDRTNRSTACRLLSSLSLEPTKLSDIGQRLPKHLMFSSRRPPHAKPRVDRLCPAADD